MPELRRPRLDRHPRGRPLTATDLELDRELRLTWPSPTAVYQLHDPDGALVYVGVTGDVLRRLDQHRAASSWWPAVALELTAVRWYRTRRLAERMEQLTIAHRHPAENVIGNPSPGRSRYVEALAAARDAEARRIVAAGGSLVDQLERRRVPTVGQPETAGP